MKFDGLSKALAGLPVKDAILDGEIVCLAPVFRSDTRIGNVHNRSLEALFGYAVVLWIPAVLYSACLWLLVVGLKIFAGRRPY